VAFSISRLKTVLSVFVGRPWHLLPFGVQECGSCKQFITDIFFQYKYYTKLSFVMDILALSYQYGIAQVQAKLRWQCDVTFKIAGRGL
jgi:hypothetical protein